VIVQQAGARRCFLYFVGAFLGFIGLPDINRFSRRSVIRSVKSTYLIPRFGKGRKLVRQISLQLILAEIVRNEQVDRTARLSVFDGGYRPALRLATLWGDDAHYELSVDVQAHG